MDNLIKIILIVLVVFLLLNYSCNNIDNFAKMRKIKNKKIIKSKKKKNNKKNIKAKKSNKKKIKVKKVKKLKKRNKKKKNKGKKLKKRNSKKNIKRKKVKKYEKCNSDGYTCPENYTLIVENGDNKIKNYKNMLNECCIQKKLIPYINFYGSNDINKFKKKAKKLVSKYDITSAYNNNTIYDQILTFLNNTIISFDDELIISANEWTQFIFRKETIESEIKLVLYDGKVSGFNIFENLPSGYNFKKIVLEKLSSSSSKFCDIKSGDFVFKASLKDYTNYNLDFDLFTICSKFTYNNYQNEISWVPDHFNQNITVREIQFLPELSVFKNLTKNELLVRLKIEKCLDHKSLEDINNDVKCNVPEVENSVIKKINQCINYKKSIDITNNCKDVINISDVKNKLKNLMNIEENLKIYVKYYGSEDIQKYKQKIESDLLGYNIESAYNNSNRTIYDQILSFLKSTEENNDDYELIISANEWTQLVFRKKLEGGDMKLELYDGKYGGISIYPIHPSKGSLIFIKENCNEDINQCINGKKLAFRISNNINDVLAIVPDEYGHDKKNTIDWNPYFFNEELRNINLNNYIVMNPKFSVLKKKI